MSDSFVLIVVVMSVIAIAVVVAPLRAKHRQAAPAKKRPEPESEYQNTLLALRDLDFDHELGVIAEDDFRRLREELVAKAAETMPRKKARGAGGPKKHAKGAQQKAARRVKVATSIDGAHGECPECGRAFQPDHAFCGKCGARLSAA